MKSHSLSVHFVIFKVAPVFFAIQTRDVKEIIHLPELMTPPGIPSFVGGFVQIEQQNIPIILISKLFGLTDVLPDLYTPLIIFKTADGPMGIMANQVAEINKMKPERIVSVDPDLTFNECVSGTFNKASHPVYILDVEKLLLKQEKDRLAAFANTLQTRLDALEKEVGD